MTPTPPLIRRFAAEDWPAVHALLQATFQAGDTYAFAPALCEHSQREARTMGFRAMQFNLVVSTNARAVRLWKRLGFAVVGMLPGAFRHAQRGYVDALVMYKALVD